MVGGAIGGGGPGATRGGKRAAGASASGGGGGSGARARAMRPRSSAPGSNKGDMISLESGSESDEEKGDEEDDGRCSSCGRDIPAANLMSHRLHCGHALGGPTAIDRSRTASAQQQALQQLQLLEYEESLAKDRAKEEARRQKEEAARQQRQRQQEKAELRQAQLQAMKNALPPEPEPGGGGGDSARVQVGTMLLLLVLLLVLLLTLLLLLVLMPAPQVRLKDGPRIITRRFPAAAALSCVLDWVEVELGGAAQPQYKLVDSVGRASYRRCSGTDLQFCCSSGPCEQRTCAQLGLTPSVDLAYEEAAAQGSGAAAAAAAAAEEGGAAAAAGEAGSGGEEPPPFRPSPPPQKQQQKEQPKQEEEEEKEEEQEEYHVDEQEEQDDDCAICQCPLTDAATLSGCHHRFDQACIQSWAKQQVREALCRCLPADSCPLPRVTPSARSCKSTG